MPHVSTEDGLTCIHLDDGKANVIHGAFLSALDRALDGAESRGDAVVICGRDGMFSGGLDLKTLPTLEPKALRDVLDHFGRAMLRLFSFPRPVVAACTGHTVAGGMVLALGADERWGVHGPFKLGLNETQLGLTLPRFIVEMARVQIPVSSYRPVIIRGELFDPSRALELGLLDGVVEPHEVVAHAKDRAHNLAALPGSSYAGNKRNIRGDAAATGGDTYPAELDAFMSSIAAARRS